ncbi:MAG: hypothetical protein IKT08_09775 [Bacteroidales bacterium]|nr:hypothetical protein [Bacteroidales bacterium]
MKNWRLFFVLLMGVILLASCQKQEGDVPGSWISADGNKALVKCTIANNVDFAAYTIKLDLEAMHVERIQIDQMDLEYAIGDLTTDSAWSDLKKITLLKDTILTSSMEIKDTLWNLIPETTYSYLVMLSDLIVTDTAVSGSFKTLDPGAPIVVIDSILMDNGRINCYASASGHWRSMQDECVYKIYYGNDTLSVDNVIDPVTLLSDTLENDTVTVSFVGDISLTPEEVWFKAYAMNSWEREAWSTAASYLFSSQPVASTIKADTLSATSVKLFGKTQKGLQNVPLHEAGFLLATHPEPSILNDSVIRVANAIWDKRYDTIVENLTPNTTYYFRAYLRITDENGAVYMGDVLTFHTSSLGGELSLEVTMDVLPSLVTDMAYTANSLLVSAHYAGELGTHQITEMGFVYRQKGIDDEEELTIEHCLGSAMGVPVSDLTQVPSIVVAMLPDNSFAAQVNELEAATEYVFRAYVVVDGDGVKRYSENTVEISTKEQ